MAVNYDLNNTGPEVQARLDQVFPNRDAIEQRAILDCAEEQEMRLGPLSIGSETSQRLQKPWETLHGLVDTCSTEGDDGGILRQVQLAARLMAVVALKLLHGQGVRYDADVMTLD